MANGNAKGAPFADKETVLLDLLAGWLEMVESCREAAELTKEEFDAEFFGEVLPETYDEWRSHYTDEYLSLVRELNSRAASEVLGEEDVEPETTPAQFLRERILPLLEEESPESTPGQ